MKYSMSTKNSYPAAVLSTFEAVKGNRFFSFFFNFFDNLKRSKYS